LIILTAVIAGLYPAIYISHFSPVSILKGQQKLGSNSLVTKSLLTTQFILAMLTIMAWTSFARHTDYFRNVDPGFRIADIINVPLPDASAYQVFKNAIKDSPDIVSIGATDSYIGTGPRYLEAEVNGSRSHVWRYRIGENYLETLGLNIVAGRTFDQALESDQKQSIIVNRNFCAVYGLSSPLGASVSLLTDNRKSTYFIIGVVDDFRIRDVDEPVEPCVMINVPESQYSVMAIRFGSKSLSHVMSDLQQSWQACFPNLLFQGWPLENIRAHEIRIADTASTVFTYVSMTTMVIIAMGLFALIALNIEKRTKEIAVHKILGASLLQISRLLMKETFWLFLVSTCIAGIAGTYLLYLLLETMFKENIGIDAMPLIRAAGIVVIIAVTTATIHLLRVRDTNPVDSLRYE
jgi:hypothetical protein